jgi:hypothetical protein
LFKIIKIQAVLRGWLVRRQRYFRRYLGSLYRMRNNERNVAKDIKRCRAHRLKNSTQVGRAVQKHIKDQIYYQHRYLNKCK